MTVLTAHIGGLPVEELVPLVAVWLPPLWLAVRQKLHRPVQRSNASRLSAYRSEDAS